MASPRRTAKGPLRKVEYDFWKRVEIFDSVLRVHFEHLECGHDQRVPTDIYGEFYSALRRCGECYKEKVKQ